MNSIDPDIARQLAADLPHDVFVGVIRTFEADLARLVRQMADAAKATDLESYRRCAHGLAGAAGAIGAIRLETLARQAMGHAALPQPDEVIALGEEARAALSELMVISAAPPRP